MEIQTLNLQVIERGVVYTQADVVACDARIDALDQLRAATYLEEGSCLDWMGTVTVDGRKGYAQLGFETFAEYCESKGMKKRRAEYLIQVWRTVRDGKISADYANMLGWSKMRHVAKMIEVGVITEENTKKWQEDLKDKSHAEIEVIRKEVVNTMVASGKVPDPKDLRKLLVYMDLPQYETVQEAIRRAKVVNGSDSLAWAMDCIAMAYLAETFNTRDDAINEILLRLERVFGGKAIFIPDSGSPEYGPKAKEDMEATLADTEDETL